MDKKFIYSEHNRQIYIYMSLLRNWQGKILTKANGAKNMEIFKDTEGTNGVKQFCSSCYSYCSCVYYPGQYSQTVATLKSRAV